MRQKAETIKFNRKSENEVYRSTFQNTNLRNIMDENIKCKVGRKVISQK